MEQVTIGYCSDCEYWDVEGIIKRFSVARAECDINEVETGEIFGCIYWEERDIELMGGVE